MPAEAEGTSKAAAKAFVRYYVDLINHATRSGDTAPLTSVSASECKSCTAVIERVESVYTAGGHIESEGWKIRSMAVVPLQDRNRPVIDVGLMLSPQRVTKRSGATPEQFDGGRLPATFYLVLRDGNWIVKRWERAA